MVKWILGLALVLATGSALWALPFLLEAPKHSNPVDPYNPDNLHQLYVQATAVAQATAIPIATATPTATACAGCTATYTPTICVPCTPVPTSTPTATACAGCAPVVIASLPANGTTVQVPYNNYYYYYYNNNWGINYADASQVYTQVAFNQDMDIFSFGSPMAVTISPKVRFSIGSAGARALYVYMSTTDTVDPLRLNTTYTITYGPSIKSVTGQGLVTYNLSFTTGGFKFLGYGGNNYYYQGFNPSSLEAVFNAPVATNVDPRPFFSMSPTALGGCQLGTNSSNYVSFYSCSGVPDTVYTLNYSGGMTGSQGGTAAAMLGVTYTSESLKVLSASGPYNPSSNPNLNLNYPVDLTSAVSSFSIMPLPTPAGTPYATNNGCGSAYNYSNSSIVGPGSYSAPYPYVSGGFYTVSLTTGVRSLYGNKPLAAAYSFSFIAP